ncbi:phenoloxidase-activating factor 2 [Phymastichus coffea]|uniref:phenoloxidase-activating factor 2 n=1 Tax=Phymastichus coffea TaxID=108790 RepID=UPI00273BD377|nr:phenoloxidase-activating factor 2 [Phymastichus coffea]
MSWMIGALSALLITSCLAAPQDKPAKGSLEDLIKDVFQTGNSPSGEAQRQNVETTTQNLDYIISQVFNQPPSNNNLPGGDRTGFPGANGGNFPGAERGGCECVPYYQCQNGSITENGAGIIDIRVQGGCDDYLEVCCTPPNLIPGQDVNIPTVRPPLERKSCGQRNPDGVGFRITGAKDNEAQFGEFPWMVAVLKEDDVGNNGEPLNVYQCGGALIHPKIVLTAAHCVFDKNPSILKIRAGEWDTQTKNEVLPHQDRLVKSVITHEQYHKGALYYDFGLLILVDPVDLNNENVGIVCLPEPTDNFDYSRCFASGWGKDIFGKEGHYQVILKRVELPIVPNDQCQNALRTTRLGKYFQLHSSFICAGGEAGKDTCKGDGGSPLVCPMKRNPSKYVQAGIVAWGIGCGENHVPGVYANIATGRSWINKQAQYAGINLNEYQSI